METIQTPDEIPAEPGVYEVVDGGDVLAIVTVPDPLDLNEIGDVSVELSGFAPRPSGRDFADALGYPVVKRMRANSRRTERRIARLVDKGYSIARIYHIPGERKATWSFTRVGR